jgi:hypothetical protein
MHNFLLDKHSNRILAEMDREEQGGKILDIAQAQKRESVEM